MPTKILRMNESKERLYAMAEKAQSDGDFLSALRFAHRELSIYGGDLNCFLRLADLYENLGLQSYAIKWLFRALDVCNEEDLPDIYEGLAVNYLNMGNEKQSAYYYNLLMDVDDTLTHENKMEIVSAFAQDKKEKFRFVFPPKLADFSKELEEGSRELKAGNCRRAIASFSKIPEGNKDYVEAQRMQALAELLEGNADEAERICLGVLEKHPTDVQTRCTLAAVYLEQNREEESARLARELAAEEISSSDELCKVATVCCENGLHREAYEKFSLLEEKMPYDGRMLYFKAVSAAKCGELKDAERVFYRFCTLYPDAAVGKYYLREVRKMLAGGESSVEDFTYFYRIPKQARELVCHTLISLGKLPREEASLIGEAESLVEDLRWCFDEMDGMDQDLQYVAFVVAEHAHSDEFLQEMLLDFEVPDVLKIETLRLLYERNEGGEWGFVFWGLHKRFPLLKVRAPKRKRKKCIAGYAKVASRIAILADGYGKKLQRAAELFFVNVETKGYFDLLESDDDIACVIYMLSGLKDLKGDVSSIAYDFDADAERVTKILNAYYTEGEEA